MKVKCIVHDDNITGLIYGQVYDVISVEWDWYRVVDQSGEDYMYSPKAFEVVEAMPEPPVLTAEDIRLDKGRMYTRGSYAEYSGGGEAGLAVAESRPLYGG
ncbi:MAG: hypothetical protein FWB94_11380 [Chitinispirillia bacterium]|nr:hypothetical protein [Chitinispirillia bacterium]